MKIGILLLSIAMLPLLLCAQQVERLNARISFRSEHDNMLYATHSNNEAQLKRLVGWVSANKEQLLLGKAHIQLVAGLPDGYSSTAEAINLSATKASTVRAYLKGYISNDHFYTIRFSRSLAANQIEVFLVNAPIAQGELRTIYYASDRTNRQLIKNTVARYGKIPLLESDSTPVSPLINEPDYTIPTTHSAPAQQKSIPATIGSFTRPTGRIFSFEFQPENVVFQINYKQNRLRLQELNRLIAEKNDLFVSGRAYLCLVANILQPYTLDLNRGATLASVMRANCRLTHRFIDDQFAFYYDNSGRKDNSIDIILVESPMPADANKNIFFYSDQLNEKAISNTVSQYGKLPTIQSEGEASVKRNTSWDLPVDVRNSIIIDVEREVPRNTAHLPIYGDTYDREVETVTFNYRINSSQLESDFMSNSESFRYLDQIFSNSEKASRVIAVSITSSASPDGPTDFNERLALDRGRVLEQLIRSRYPAIPPQHIFLRSAGENWEGLRILVADDYNVPYQPEVLALLDRNVNPTTRERQLRDLRNGVPFRYLARYILPQLRSAAAVSLFYKQSEQTILPKRDEAVQVPDVKPRDEMVVVPESAIPPPVVHPTTSATVPDLLDESDVASQQQSMQHDLLPPFKRPFAIKTNMLFDLATMFNLEVEVPLGNRFSLLGEWIFPWWGGLGNNGGVSPIIYSEDFTMQMLSGSLEGRYWLPRSPQMDQKARKWGDYNPLNGWFVGASVGFGVYDFQFWGDGYQGESYLSFGATAGYAHPISKHLHLEYSIGIGYFQTDYRRYYPQEGHKIYIHDGKYTWLGPNKAKISLVWIPQLKRKVKHINY